MEVDGVDQTGLLERSSISAILCDLCFLTKCPYVPPHEWDVDFPHLMLQRQGRALQVSATGCISARQDPDQHRRGPLFKLAGHRPASSPSLVNAAATAIRPSLRQGLEDARHSAVHRRCQASHLSQPSRCSKRVSRDRMVPTCRALPSVRTHGQSRVVRDLLRQSQLIPQSGGGSGRGVSNHNGIRCHAGSRTPGKMLWYAEAGARRPGSR